MVKEKLKIFVIEIGVGNVYIYIDEFVDLDMVVKIVINVKI